MATLCPSGGGGSQLLVGSSPRHCGPGSCHPARDILLTHPGPRGQLSETRLVIWGNVWSAIVLVCVQKASLCVKHWLDGAWASSWLVASPSSASAYRPHPAYRPNQIDRGIKQLDFGLPGFKTWEPGRFGWGSTSQLGTSCRWGAPRKVCWQLLHPWYIMFFF